MICGIFNENDFEMWKNLRLNSRRRALAYARADGADSADIEDLIFEIQNIENEQFDGEPFVVEIY